MSANRYTPDGSAIIAANGKEYAVETAHELPLPDGIDSNATIDGAFFCSIGFGGNGQMWQGYQDHNTTHWLARRPLPPVPKVKTQAELDADAFDAYWKEWGDSTSASVHRFTWHKAIAYARKCPAKPAA